MAPNRKRPSTTGEDGSKRRRGDTEARSNSLEKIKNRETLANISRGSVGKLLTRVKSRGSKGFKHEGSINGTDERGNLPEAGSMLDAASCSIDAEHNLSPEGKVKEQSFKLADYDKEDEPDETEWEDGSVSASYSANDVREDSIQGVTVEFDVLPTPSKRKVVRRATAEEKEAAELAHKVHLLCLIGRGRLIDKACDDPLIQASLLSILPMHLLKIGEVSKLTSKALTPILSWFRNNFRVQGSSHIERPFHLALASALETHEGTSEEVAALSVALFRALKLTTRFVSILDVVRLKPDGDKSESPGQGPTKAGGGVFNSSTLMVAGSNSSHPHFAGAKSSASDNKESSFETSLRGGRTTRARKSLKENFQSKYSSTDDKSKEGTSDQSASIVQDNGSDAYLAEKTRLKRKGDLEYELQLEMALSATAVESCPGNTTSDMEGSCSTSNLSAPSEGTKKIIREGPLSSHGISTAIGSKKVGAPLYWAEVFCNGENLTGKWVHVDAVNALIDGEQKVEAAAAACKRSLRYVVAFAGQGAKDVTRRYCAKWYKIAPERISSIWWDEVLAPLKDLESSEYAMKDNSESSTRNSLASRSALEDMELETRALTEPLPTNQQAYKNHPLYAIERWLNKYQMLYPKGPILGLCSGHPVYPRTCVKTLHTKQRWLREGLEVKAGELPAKVLNRSQKNHKAEDGVDDDFNEGDHGGTVALYGKWQTGPLCLPHAVDGIVPKNERGQVDVWSEKCLPPGTVHLRFPRLPAIAKRLEIDYAPAMVGFDFRNGQSVPVYEGIVVCSEFEDIILEAYAEEENRREAEERRRNEVQALSRWYQLLSSIVMRQRLHNCYKDGASSQTLLDTSKLNDSHATKSDDPRESASNQQVITPDTKPNTPPFVLTEDHQHEFFLENQASDEEGSTRTKRCRCGFSIQVEEL